MQWLPFTVSLSWDEVLPPGGYTENNFYYATMETIMCREKQKTCCGFNPMAFLSNFNTFISYVTQKA